MTSNVALSVISADHHGVPNYGSTYSERCDESQQTLDRGRCRYNFVPPRRKISPKMCSPRLTQFKLRQGIPQFERSCCKSLLNCTIQLVAPSPESYWE